MTLPAGARLVAYLRDSGGPDQDLSLVQQEQAIRTWAQDQGHTITRVFSDEALSGTRTAGRHGFEALLQHFRHPECPDQGLILWKFSRLARDFDDAQFFKADLRRRGFEVLAIQDKIPEGSMGRFFEAAIDYMNERYSRDLATDVQRGLRHAIRTHGIVPGSVTKPGFRRQEVVIGAKRNGQPHIAHRWVIDPRIAAKVLDAFRMKSAGATTREIHEKHHLYSTVHSYTYLWSAEIYRGRFRFGADPHNQIIIENYVEPIVDEATWNAVQLLVQQYRERHVSSARHPRRVASRFLLSGLVRCAHCGYVLVGQSKANKYKARYGYYSCKSARLRPHLGCPGVIISAKKLEEAVLASLKEFILAPTNLQRLHALVEKKARRPLSDQTERADRKAAVKKLNAEIDRLVAAIAAAGHSDALLQRLKDLEAKRNGLLQEGATDRALPPVHVPTLDELNVAAQAALTGLNGNRLTIKRLLRHLVKEIRVHREGKQLYGVIEYYLPTEDVLSLGLGFQQPTGRDFAVWSTKA